jgi:tetratricopeptide (TPR) repeat protein
MTADEIERALLQQVEETEGSSKQALWDLAVFYSRTRRQVEAADCISRINAMTADREERASCTLAMGQLQEQLGDFGAAARYYETALESKPEVSDTCYWLNNNLGYSLLQLDRPREAIAYLEAAVTVDRGRPNAYKNLGLAHRLLGDFARAAECFVVATQVNAADPRSVRHLEELVEAHPGLLAEVPDLRERVAACRSAVERAASEQPDFAAHWKKLRDGRGRPD